MISKDRLVLQKQIYNFLRTVTIKFEPIADHQNTFLISKGHIVNLDQPETWKYYLNMTGQYHSSDTLMYVTSLDTRENILFSVENLSAHPRTRSVYLPGGLYYNRLCALYPEQVDLIKSILFPVSDIEKAINAEDLILLNYGSGYLEEYEEGPLVEEIVKFLEILNDRWYFKFLDDEPYFYITFWSYLWRHLAMLIMSTRESYIRTPYVHTWYLWNTLKAHGIDDYSDILDRKKSMMLYQNINYLTANAGKQSNLIILANALLSDFGVSIYGRKVVQETETGADDYQLTPQLQAVKILTDNSTIITEISSATVSTIQSATFAKGLTKSLAAESIKATERKLGDTKLNDFMTKFLEIRPITKSKVYSDILNGFLLETLIVSIIDGYYSEPITVTDQATETSLYLRPKELLAIYNYAVMKSIGITPTDIPNKFILYKAFSTTLQQPAKIIMRGDEKVYISSHIDSQAYLNGLYYNTQIQSPAEFSEMLERLWLRYLEHMLLDQKTKIGRKGYILQYMSSLVHERKVREATLIPGFTDYEKWLGPEGIDIASTVLTQYEINSDSMGAWKNLADSIISALVPITETLDYFGNFTLSDYGFDRLQKLFIQMCSYRVVFLTSSREIPNFAAAGKWSTDYGPDKLESYRHILYSSIVSSEIKAQMNASTINYNGFCESSKVSMAAPKDYTVTPSEELLHRSTMQFSNGTRLGSLNEYSTSVKTSSDITYTPIVVGSMLD